MIGLIVLLIGLLIAAFNMRMAVFVMLALVYGVVPEFFQSGLFVASVVIYPGEMLLLCLGVFVLIKNHHRSTYIMWVVRPVSAPFFVLGLMYVIGIAYSVGFKHDSYGLAETRNLVGWLALPLAIFLFKNNFHRTDLYLRTFAMLAAVMMVAQAVLGTQLLFSGRGAEQISDVYSDVIRGSVGAAIFLIGYGLFYALGRAVMARRKVLWIVIFNALGFAIIVSFTRGTWFAAFIGLLMFLYLTRMHLIFRGTLVYAVLFAILFGAGLVIAKPDLGAAIEERILSIFEEGDQGTSVGFRLDENEQAMRSVTNNPLLGVGIGGEYKEYSGTTGGSVRDGEFVYIHNSYLGLAVKFGVLAAIVPLWIFWNLWKVGRRHRFRLEKNTIGPRLNIAAAISALCMYMINAMTQPEWLRLGGLISLSLLIAVILAAAQEIDAEERRRVGRNE